MTPRSSVLVRLAAFALLSAAACVPVIDSTRTMRGPRTGLTHPLLDIDPDHEFREYRSFRAQLVRLVDERRAKGDVDEVSVYFRDLDNGPVVSVLDSAPFRPASLLKVPIMISYLKARESDPDALRRRLVCPAPQANPLKQAFPPAEPLIPGKEYSIDELLTAMIARSDNLAARALLDDLKTRDYLQVYADLGLHLPSIRDVEDPVSVRGYASFFRILYNASYLNRAMSEKALRYLAAGEFALGLRAGVPAAVVVAHKFGETDDGKGGRQLHDCGIVYHAHAPYLLCVMTKGKDMGRLASVIADISALVYRRVDEGSPGGARGS